MASKVDLAVQRIIALRGSDVLPMAIPHVCSRRRCRPMSEMDLMEAGLLPRGAPLYHPGVYVCGMRAIHVCTEDTCSQQDPEGVCAVSGICFQRTSSAPGPRDGFIPMRRPPASRPGAASAARKRARDDEDDAAAARDGEAMRQSAFGVLLTTGGDGGGDGADDLPPQPQQQQQQQPSRKERTKYAEKAETVVTDIFYSGTRRQINERKRDVLDTQRDQEVAGYYAACKAGRTFPVLVEIARIRASYDMQMPHMRILKRDEQVIKRLVSAILQTWDIVKATPWSQQNPGYRFDTHALSVLYLMRKGLVVGGTCLIPADPYTASLPIRADLPAFGKRYASAVVTAGMRNIRRAYESAVGQAGWTVERLSLRRE